MNVGVIFFKMKNMHLYELIYIHIVHEKIVKQSSRNELVSSPPNQTEFGSTKPERSLSY